MSMAIGYNINKAEEVVENIAAKYNDLGNYMGSEWPSVTKALHDNWVGDDEADFEKELANRINTLYRDARNLAVSCTETICNLGNAWIEFQSNNTLSGAKAESSAGWLTDKSVTTSSIKTYDAVSANPPSLNGDTDRGLTNENSAAAIMSVVGDYVEGIKAKTTELFSEVDSNIAFYGEQTSSINKYIESCGTAISEVSVAIKDLHEALETLAGTSYVNASSSVSEQVTEGISQVADSLSNLGDSRWV